MSHSNDHSPLSSPSQPGFLQEWCTLVFVFILPTHSFTHCILASLISPKWFFTRFLTTSLLCPGHFLDPLFHSLLLKVFPRPLWPHTPWISSYLSGYSFIISFADSCSPVDAWRRCSQSMNADPLLCIVYIKDSVSSLILPLPVSSLTHQGIVILVPGSSTLSLLLQSFQWVSKPTNAC